MQTSSSLSIEAAETIAPASILSSPLQLETLVNVFRSDRLAWQVITSLKLPDAVGFLPRFKSRFPNFNPDQPTPEEQSYLIDAFERRLTVRALPRTLLIEIRFRCKDAALSAAIVNHLIAGYVATEGVVRMDATKRDSSWLQLRLDELTRDVAAKEKHLAIFERQHNFTSAQQTVPGGQAQETLHDPTMLQIDEAGRLLASASGDRILRESLYREAEHGDPEQVLAANPGLAAEMGPNGVSLVQQLRARASEAAMEQAQLKVEHGPNFPRLLELERASADIQQQIVTQDANITESFRRAWKASAERERLLRRQLDERMAEGVRQNDATIRYSVLHEEIESDRSLCTRLTSRIREASLAAGVHASTIQVLDSARVPFKPVAPDPPLYLAITLFAGSWIGLVTALILDCWQSFGARKRLNFRAVSSAATLLAFALTAFAFASAQAPTPNTSGLPSGVVHFPADSPTVLKPNPKESPAIWSDSSPAGQGETDADRPLNSRNRTELALPISPGDSLEISEFHTPDFRSQVRVAAEGTISLPLIGRLNVSGLSELEAAEAIEKAFITQGILLHPQVSVLVTNAVGQDVSVMGEVSRPGIYPYAAHHRLLDLISAASGLSPNAGRLVNLIHRATPNTPVALILDPTFALGSATSKAVSGPTGKIDQNPELLPGDTLLVSRAGLAYVIGDVVRPGGFAVDPVQGLTVVQAISLAWGATPNASASKAILIRDQTGGRTLTTLNLRRMIRGQDPDIPIKDRDILFVPDSTTRTLLNKSLESAIQSAIGVSIYAGLVYSQRF